MSASDRPRDGRAIEPPDRAARHRATTEFDRNLVVTAAFVDEGPTMKRFRPRAQGRATRINKRTSHITVVVTPKTTKGGTR